MTVQDALLRGLRRPRNEPQLTQALAAVLAADRAAARAFLGAVFASLGVEAVAPPEFEVAAEEIVGGDRFDLRFRSPGWDVILELKLYAGYGREQLSRYLAALQDVEHGYLAAVTRDLPLYGEPSRDEHPRWLGSVRWRDLLPTLHELPVEDGFLRTQWKLFLSLLEEEGSMGFTRPKPELFDAFAQAREANRHMEEFLRVLERPLLEALQDVLGGQDQASLYWKRGGRFSRATHSNRIDIPFRVPKDGPGRVRAGIMGWSPPATFYVAPVPSQRWTTRSFSPLAQEAVDLLVAGGHFDAEWMHAHLGLTEDLIRSDKLEQTVVEWAHERFVELRESGLFAVPVDALGRSGDADEEA